MKYSLSIQYIEEVSGQMTEIIIYSDKNPEFSYVNKFEMNSKFKLVYLVF